MRFLTLLLLSVLFLLSGCGKTTADKITQIKVASGAEQCLLPGGKLSTPLRVSVTGESKKNLFGKSSRLPVQGAVITFKSPDNAKVRIKPVTVTSDIGGIAEADLIFPECTGEQLVEIIPHGTENQKIVARIFSGIEITGKDAEYFTGNISHEPIRVRLTRNGKGISGIPVKFKLGNTVEGTEKTAQILTPEAVTDSKGEAATFVRMGKKTGRVNIMTFSSTSRIFSKIVISNSIFPDSVIFGLSECRYCAG